PPARRSPAFAARPGSEPRGAAGGREGRQSGRVGAAVVAAGSPWAPRPSGGGAHAGRDRKPARDRRAPAAGAVPRRVAASPGIAGAGPDPLALVPASALALGCASLVPARA